MQVVNWVYPSLIILSNPFSPFARYLHPLNYSYMTKTITEQLWERGGQEPPGRGRNDQLGLGTSWSRLGMTIQFRGFCNISRLRGTSLPKGTSSRLNSLCALPYLTFIHKPIAVCTYSTNLTDLPGALLLHLIFYHPPGQKLLVLPRACWYSSCTSFPILSTKFYISFPLILALQLMSLNWILNPRSSINMSAHCGVFSPSLVPPTSRGFMERQVLPLPGTSLQSLTTVAVLCRESLPNTEMPPLERILESEVVRWFFADNEEKVITDFPESASLRKRNRNVQLGWTPGTRGNGL